MPTSTRRNAPFLRKSPANSTVPLGRCRHRPLQTSRESSAYFAGFQKRLAVGGERDFLRRVLYLYPNCIADLVQLRLDLPFEITRREKPGRARRSSGLADGTAIGTSVKSSAEIPVSSRVSRTAACLAVSPGSTCPFGNDQRLPARIIRTVSPRKTIAPAESVVRSSSLEISRRTSCAICSRFSFVTVSTRTFGCVRMAFVSGVSAIFCTTPRIGTLPSRSASILAGKLRRRAFHPPDLVHENQPRLLRIFERLHACRLKRLREFFDAAPAAFADADAVEIAHRGRFLRRRKQIDGHRAVRQIRHRNTPEAAGAFYFQRGERFVYDRTFFRPARRRSKICACFIPFLAFSVPASCARQRISSAAIEMAISSGVSGKDRNADRRMDARKLCFFNAVIHQILIGRGDLMPASDAADVARRRFHRLQQHLAVCLMSGVMMTT